MRNIGIALFVLLLFVNHQTNLVQSWTIMKRKPLNRLFVGRNKKSLLRRRFRTDAAELTVMDKVTLPESINVTPQQHEVLRLIRSRTLEGSIPGNRTDTCKIALCIEGGGMRGAVAAGMVAALPLDAFDVVYGSSAGALIGAYAVARQTSCLDVYDYLVHSKNKFVSTKRFIANMGLTLVDKVFDTQLANIPAMNLSYVLDEIMTDHKPIDMEAFRRNNKLQPLRVVVSCFDNSTLTASTFGYGDRIRFGKREGLEAALEASMSVPAATGPLRMLYMENSNSSVIAMDGFCQEPIPYRSAVADGATHVLVLCTKCSGHMPKRSIYERVVTPLFFHRLESLKQFFHGGHQQEIYANDLKLMSQAKEGSLVAVNGNQAYILPIQLPSGTPELGTTQLCPNAVEQSIRAGYQSARQLLGDLAEEMVFDKLLQRRQALQPEAQSASHR